MSDLVTRLRREFAMLQSDSAADASGRRSLIRKQADRIEALERENAELRSAHHDATEGISGTLLRDRVEALETALREARECIGEEVSSMLDSGCVKNEVGEPTRDSLDEGLRSYVEPMESALARIDALLTGGDK